MKSGEKYNRRSFIKTIGLAGAILPFLQYCSQKTKTLLLKISGTNHVLGHRLWAKNFPKPSEDIKIPILIVGSGISGLSAARYLALNSNTDFLICEMENRIGGNSSYGENKHSKFPFAAHYLPLPNKEDVELISFLKESRMYLGDDYHGQPILDDYQLVFPQEERLFYKNVWQSGLIPQKGVSKESQDEVERFLKLMTDYREKKDRIGKYWFTIPLHDSSDEVEAKMLDKITFSDWLKKQNFRSEELLWYLNYSCKDDYGFGISEVSAWAGIHYFAGRKHNWCPERNDQVFTWPEGNARLTKYLSKHSKSKSLQQHLIYQVEETKDAVEVLMYDAVHNTSKRILADKVIMCTPQFVNNYLFKNRKVTSFKYVPWLVATLTLKKEFGLNEQLSWDNVIFGAEGLGYIYNQHQNLDQNIGEKVISFYLSFTDSDTLKSRKKLLSMSDLDLKNLVLADLKKAHPLIEDLILEIEFNKIGHAMIAPIPNHIFGEETKLARQNINNKIFFAHSDLSGISIFEEAFHQGIRAAKEVLK